MFSSCLFQSLGGCRNSFDSEYSKIKHWLGTLWKVKEEENSDFRAVYKAFKTVHSNYIIYSYNTGTAIEKKRWLNSLKSTLSKANNTISEAENKK